MKFIATAKGFIHDRLVQPGESFEEEDGFKCSWAVPEKDYEAAEEKTPEVLAEEAKEGLQGSKKKAAKKKAAKKKAAKKKASKKVAKAKE